MKYKILSTHMVAGLNYESFLESTKGIPIDDPNYMYVVANRHGGLTEHHPNLYDPNYRVDAPTIGTFLGRPVVLGEKLDLKILLGVICVVKREE